jgi:hypothetical protein
VEPFQKISTGPLKEDDTTVASQGSLLGQSSTGTGKKKKAGRPKGGGRTSLKKQGSCGCAYACYSIIVILVKMTRHPESEHTLDDF